MRDLLVRFLPSRDGTNLCAGKLILPRVLMNETAVRGVTLLAQSLWPTQGII